MRGRQDQKVSMLAFIDAETHIPLDHPLRTIKRLADAALTELSLQTVATWGNGVHSGAGQLDRWRFLQVLHRPKSTAGSSSTRST